MAKKNKTSYLLPIGLLAGAFLLFKKKDTTVSGINGKLDNEQFILSKEESKNIIKIIHVDNLEDQVPYWMFNSSGIKFNEEYLKHVVLENRKITVINNVPFIAYIFNREGTKYCFGVKMRFGNSWRQNSSQVITK